MSVGPYILHTEDYEDTEDVMFVEPNEINPQWENPRRMDRRNKLQKLPFVAWDGEGYDDENGVHHYMLFGNSLGTSVQGASLDYTDCFELLLDAPAANHVIYGGDYDIIMMTRTMPKKVVKRLLAGKPTKYKGYRMEWFRKKYFQLSDNKKRSVRLYDVMTFFSTSFVKACRQYLGEEPALDTMHEMKLKRGEFTQNDSTVVEYWKSELDYLVRLMDELRRLLHEVGIEPQGWHGPGAVAGALLSSHKMGKHLGDLDDNIVDLAERAYYGGRFEQFKVGKHERVHEYDIRSAYPTAIAKLPSLEGITWEHWRGYGDFPFHGFGLYCVSWDTSKYGFPRISVPGPLPWRDDNGRIYYPSRGTESWYWGVEIQNLFSFKGCYTVHECYIPTFASSERPFSWVEDMYNERARLKEEGNPAPLAVKLGLNSLYGKLAQSKGAKFREDEWHKPRWHNAVYAGWITAYTRRLMFLAMTNAKRHVIAVETDAIFSDIPLDKLDVGTGLGQWEHTEMDQILYIQSGVYYSLKDGVYQLKSRGVEVDKSQSAEYWLDIFNQLPHDVVTVEAKVRRFGTDIRSDNYATWFDFERSTTLPVKSSKRIHYPKQCWTCGLAAVNGVDIPSYAEKPHYLIVPEPVLESNMIPSTPYPFPWRPDRSFTWPKEWVIRDADIPMEISWT